MVPYGQETRRRGAGRVSDAMQFGGARGGGVSRTGGALCGLRAEPVAVHDRGDVPRVEHSCLDDAGRDHSRDGAGCHGDGEPDFLGLVHRGDLGNRDRLRGAPDCDLGAGHVRRVVPVPP